MAQLKASSLIIFFFVNVISVSATETIAGRSDQHSGQLSSLARRSCTHARYSDLCLRTLSSGANTPAGLARAAVYVSLSGARNATEYLAGMRRRSLGGRRVKGAVEDCVEELSESVDQLRRTLSELRVLRRGSFRWQMGNAETWVSAALTNEDTCLDGFDGLDGGVKAAVREKIVNVAQLTSNALYLINLLASNRP